MEKTQNLNIANNKNLLLTFITLLVLNAIALITLTKKTGVYNLDGSYSEANSTALIATALIGLVISIPLMCAVISSIIAIFINRQQSYGKRFIRILLFTLVSVYLITFIRYTIVVFSL